jgi:cytochrome oxidase assembly protein ShyY1
VSFRFLRSPLWVAGLSIAVCAVAAFSWLGAWQLRRLEERRALNATIESRSEAAPVDLASLSSGAEDMEWRRVTATGTYDQDGQVVLEGRSHLSTPGSNVLTPLVLGDGRAVIVDRGWIPIAADPPRPASGIVTVVGILRPDEGSGLLAGASGPVTRIGSIDLERLAAQTAADLLPVYLQLESQEPGQGEAVVPVPPIEPSEGPHLSYAVQWFLFAAIVLIGFPALVARTARAGVTRPRTPSTPSSGP